MLKPRCLAGFQHIVETGSKGKKSKIYGAHGVGKRGRRPPMLTVKRKEQTLRGKGKTWQ